LSRVQAHNFFVLYKNFLLQQFFLSTMMPCCNENKSLQEDKNECNKINYYQGLLDLLQSLSYENRNDEDTVHGIKQSFGFKITCDNAKSHSLSNTSLNHFKVPVLRRYTREMKETIVKNQQKDTIGRLSPTPTDGVLSLSKQQQTTEVYPIPNLSESIENVLTITAESNPESNLSLSSKLNENIMTTHLDDEI
jgi:hypothetical protein